MFLIGRSLEYLYTCTATVFLFCFSPLVHFKIVLLVHFKIVVLNGFKWLGDVYNDSKGNDFLETKATRDLGHPPLMIAGMTPTTSLKGIKLVAAGTLAGWI